MISISSKPLKQLRNQYAVVAAILLIVVILLKCLKTIDPKRLDFFDFFLNVIVNVLASAVFIWFIADRIDKGYREEVTRTVDKTVSQVLPDYAPTNVFHISDEDDRSFHISFMKDLGGTKRYFFSGLSARVALARLDLPEAGVIDHCIFRLPLSDSSLDRAVTIFHEVRANEKSKNPKSKREGEFFGFKGDRRKLLDMVQCEDYAQHKNYLKEIVEESILFAYHITREHHWTIEILDWDDFTESRVEFTDSVIYIGNYHPLGGEYNFGPGTVRFKQGSFVWFFLKDAIEPQFKRCESASREIRLRFVNADDDETAKEKVRAFKFLENSDLVNTFSKEEAARRFVNFRKHAYKSEEPKIDE